MDLWDLCGSESDFYGDLETVIFSLDNTMEVVEWDI